jgi:hypothetical protein
LNVEAVFSEKKRRKRKAHPGFLPRARKLPGSCNVWVKAATMQGAHKTPGKPRKTYRPHLFLVVLKNH